MPQMSCPWLVLGIIWGIKVGIYLKATEGPRLTFSSWKRGVKGPLEFSV